MAHKLIEIGTPVTAEKKYPIAGEFIFEEIYGTYQGFEYHEAGIVHVILESFTGDIKLIPEEYTIYEMAPIDVQGIQDYAVTLYMPMNQLDTLLN